MLAIWSLVPLPFLNPAWTTGLSWFTYCWSLAWRILSITSVWDECDCAVDWAFFGIAFLWDWNEKWPFQSCGHCWVLQIFWHIECSTFTASSFRIWNSSTGILSAPLALFVVMLPEAHWTSHSRVSVSRWVITPSWLSATHYIPLILMTVLKVGVITILQRKKPRLRKWTTGEYTASRQTAWAHVSVWLVDLPFCQLWKSLKIWWKQKLLSSDFKKKSPKTHTHHILQLQKFCDCPLQNPCMNPCGCVDTLRAMSHFSTK